MVTNDVLDMSKIDAGNMTLSELPFDAVKTVTTTAKMFYTEMSSKVCFKISSLCNDKLINL